MKTYSLKSLLGGAAIAGTIMFMPLAVSAFDTATTSSSVRINHDGKVSIVNAEVTSVTGNLITAITRFKNTIVNWAFATNASTTINVVNATPVPNDIVVGDRLNVTGMVTTTGSSLGLDAISIKNFARPLKEKTATSTHAVTGKVVSVNITNGTFVMKTSKDTTVTVQTNASTTFKLAKSTTTSTLASLAQDAKVTVIGTANANGSILVATQIVAKLDDDKDKKDNKGSSHGLKNGWKEKEDRDNHGEHKGFLKLFSSDSKDDNKDNDNR